MGRRSRYVRDACGASTRKKTVRRLFRVGQHERTAAQCCAQKDLEAPVPPNIVERAPDGGEWWFGLRRLLLDDNAGKGVQRMQHELRCARCSGGQQYPFGVMRMAPLANWERQRGLRRNAHIQP